MARLCNLNQSDFVLPSRCLIGRSSLAHVRLTRPTVSAEHAVVYWQRGAWWVRDLGSNNGTALNGSPLPAGTSASLVVGSTVDFGDSDERWTLVEGEPPEPCALSKDTRQIRAGQGGLLLLPDESAPEASVYAHNQGWRCEHGERAREVQSGDELQLASGTWLLILPESANEPSVATEVSAFHLDKMTVEIGVSSDEERVRVVLLQNGARRELPPRSYAYMLLTLARERMAAEGADGGWVHADDLARHLRCTREKMNVDIHRLRQLTQRAGVSDAGRIVERHPETCQLRIGTGRLHIQRM